MDEKESSAGVVMWEPIETPISLSPLEICVRDHIRRKDYTIPFYKIEDAVSNFRLSREDIEWAFYEVEKILHKCSDKKAYFHLSISRYCFGYLIYFHIQPVKLGMDGLMAGDHT